MRLPPTMILQVSSSPPKATANSAEKTGSIAMMTAALAASIRACAQHCPTSAIRPTASAR